MMKYLDGQVAVSFMSVSTVEGNKVTTGVWGGGGGGEWGERVEAVPPIIPEQTQPIRPLQI